MFDLKVISSVLSQLEEERGIPRERVIEAISSALATAYKKEYGKKGQIIRASFEASSGKVDFYQVKIVVDESRVIVFDEGEDRPVREEGDERIYFNPEQHIMINDAKKIKKDAELDEEIIFPLESKGDYGRIAAQTAKQVIIQKIREAEKVSVLHEFGERENDIVSGTVQRMERGSIFIDLGRATGLLPYEEQIPGERYKQGERIRALLTKVEESPRGVFLKLSRSAPTFLEKLFAIETPEISSGVVEVKGVAREAGSRSKVAVHSNDRHIDAVGSMVGQRGVRVSTVMSELRGEKIDIIEWSEDPKKYVAEALSPAEVINVEVDEENKKATVEVSDAEQSLAIGKGGQNVRLAAKLTGWKIDIKSSGGKIASSDVALTEGETTEVKKEAPSPILEAVSEAKEKENEGEGEKKTKSRKKKPEEKEEKTGDGGESKKE